ncbi:SNARE associated Golgi protein [Artemisia annua]|uniref:SNARE associated Golgi protein n=1 Tax=Artemisia annua TaxID=35608 RepID=A0A2U1MMU4_ARTAN|nr:SNARE associated Golgi protein [Artemisia annua]
MKAMQCGRVHIKSAPYDTISLNRSPSWLKKDCSEFGPPSFSSPNGHNVPLSSILPHVQIESILWGFGTAIGELPPYFISRAASISGAKSDELEEFSNSMGDHNGSSSNMDKMKRWFLSHSQYLNFFTILLLASELNHDSIIPCRGGKWAGSTRLRNWQILITLDHCFLLLIDELWLNLTRYALELPELFEPWTPYANEKKRLQVVVVFPIRNYTGNFIDLQLLRQGPNESFEEFTERFNTETMKIPGLSDQQLIGTFISGMVKG